MIMCFFRKKCLNVRQKLGTRNSAKLALSHLLTLDMLNNICFHVYAPKSLFIDKKNFNVFLGHPQHRVTDFG